MAVLSAIVGLHPTRSMDAFQPELADGGAVGRQLVGRDRLGVDARVSQKPTQQLQRHRLIPALLDKDIENLALVIDSPPEPHLPPADADVHLIQMPAAGRRLTTPTQVRRDQRAKLDNPASNLLAADFDSALGEQFLDIPNAEREAEIQPYRLADHIRREPMAFERDRLHEYPHFGAQTRQTGDLLQLDCQHQTL